MATPTVNFQFARNTRPAKNRDYLRLTDGDSIYIEQPVRFVSCDTPEKARYAGKPPVSQPKLDRCRQRLENGFYNALPDSLRQYLIAKLTADAAQRHIDAANDATDALNRLIEDRLTLPDGEQRDMAVIPAGEFLDSNGRLLAYLAPWFRNTAADPLPPRNHPDRRTFNLDMVASGWAAFFPIFPSLPNNADMNLAIAEAEAAWDQQKGAWEKYGQDLLLAYEYRMCIKLAAAPSAGEGINRAFQRVCVDLNQSVPTIVGKFGFSEVAPPYRLWIWEDDVEAAKEALDLAE